MGPFFSRPPLLNFSELQQSVSLHGSRLTQSFKLRTLHLQSGTRRACCLRLLSAVIHKTYTQFTRKKKQTV